MPRISDGCRQLPENVICGVTAPGRQRGPRAFAHPEASSASQRRMPPDSRSLPVRFNFQRFVGSGECSWSACMRFMRSGRLRELRYSGLAGERVVDSERLSFIQEVARSIRVSSTNKIKHCLSFGQHRTSALSENLSELPRVVRGPSSNRGLATRTRS